MSEVIWDTVVRSVESLTKKTNDLQDQVSSLPDHSEELGNIRERLDAAETEINALPAKIFMPLPEILRLTTALETHSKRLREPLKQEVRHEHHVTNPIWACLVMGLTIIGLLFLEYYTWFQADLRKQNDIKYRFIQAFAAPDQRKALDGIDSDYNENPERFTKSVLDREKVILDSFQDVRREQEKQQDINNIQEKWKRQSGSKSY